MYKLLKAVFNHFFYDRLTDIKFVSIKNISDYAKYGYVPVQPKHKEWIYNFEPWRLQILIVRILIIIDKIKVLMLIIC
jgi:hypothetical protein